MGTNNPKYYSGYRVVQKANIGTSPFFSVYIPTYNRPEFLLEAVNSVLDNKGFDDYEIVISDNNPDPNNPSIKAISALSSGHISYYQNSENIGLLRNNFMAAYHCRGRWLVLLDDDDLLSPYFFKIMSEAIERKKLNGMIGCKDIRFSGNYSFSKNGIKCRGYKVSPTQVFAGNRGAGAGTLMKREDWLEIAFGDVTAAYDDYLMGDMVFEYLLAQKKGLYRIDAQLSATRISQNAATNNLGVEFLMGIHKFWDSYKFDSFHNFLSKGIFLKQITESMLIYIIRNVDKSIDFLDTMKKIFGEKYRETPKILRRVCELYDSFIQKINSIKLITDKYYFDDREEKD